jgi:nucleotidyltransferase/DNA polymerase involved in DNA repair
MKAPINSEPGRSTPSAKTPPGTVKPMHRPGGVNRAVDTAIGERFVVSTDVQRRWTVGARTALRLSGNGVSVLADT